MRAICGCGPAGGTRPQIEAMDGGDGFSGVRAASLGRPAELECVVRALLIFERGPGGLHQCSRSRGPGLLHWRPGHFVRAAYPRVPPGDDCSGYGSGDVSTTAKVS